MADPMDAFETWLLRRVAEAVEAEEVSSDLLADLQNTGRCQIREYGTSPNTPSGASVAFAMPGQPRLDVPETLKHVRVRGLERRAIFRDERDRTEFVTRVAHLTEQGAWTVSAWTLLPDHAHLLVRTGTRPLPHSMRSLLIPPCGTLSVAGTSGAATSSRDATNPSLTGGGLLKAHLWRRLRALLRNAPAARSSNHGRIHTAQPRTRYVSPSSSASPSLDWGFLTKRRRGRTTAA